MERTVWLCALILFSQFVFSDAVDTVKFEVSEEREAGVFVGNMSGNPVVESFKRLTNVKGLIRFHFQGLVPPNSFMINDTTGIIRTAGKLDRENLSLFDDKFQLQVKVSRGKISAVIPTEIKLLDINDNSPDFSENVEHVAVSESAPLGAELPIAVAKDKDIGNNSVQTYEIVSRNDEGIFQLKISRPTLELTKVKLVVSKRLDRETNNSFYLVIEAKDGGKPPRAGRKGLNVTVLDSNDHIPKFTRDLYVGEVKENSQAGTFVLQVSASDGDSGTNAEIVYSLRPQPRHENLFILNAQTGELRTNAVLDYELSKTYQLEVTARDKGPDSIPSTAVVNVKVLDENDNSPEITVTSFQEAFDLQGKIPEDSAINTAIADVKVRDKDSGRNGRVKVKLRHDKDDFSLQKLFPGQYILKIQRQLSLDRYPQYNIKIIAEDEGFPISRQESRVLSVQLADSNRNAPVFPQRIYNLEIKDDVTVSEVITMVTAIDKDDGRNAELTYSLESVRVGERNGSEEDKTKWFAIDLTTGGVSVLAKLWCVFTPSFLLNIDVRDDGRIPFHGKTTLNISVECAKHVYNFTVLENEPAGTEVGRIPVSPIAPDRPLWLSLASPDNKDFAMDNKTGILTTKRTLDREDAASYSLRAVLSDGSVDLDLVIHVIVKDVNDNPPVFVGLPGHLNITVTNAFIIGETVLKVDAVDKDSGLNGFVKYTIISGNDDQVFYISRTGKITLRKKLTKTFYYLAVIASDSGSNEKESVLRLGIFVRFITPAPPPPPPMTTRADPGAVDNRKGDGGFFSDTKMIIVVAACAGFLVLTVFLTVLFCVKCRRKGKKKAEGADKRGSYHEPDISREDALQASKKMFHQATTKQRKSPEVANYGLQQKPMEVSPIPIKRMHPMTHQTLGAGSPTETVCPDMYYPVDQEVAPECYSSEEEPDSGRGGSSRGSSPYCTHSPPTKKREDDWRTPHHVRYNPPAPYRALSPGMPPPPPPYEEVQKKRAYVTISGVTHSTTEL